MIIAQTGQIIDYAMSHDPKIQAEHKTSAVWVHGLKSFCTSNLIILSM